MKKSVFSGSVAAAGLILLVLVLTVVVWLKKTEADKDNRDTPVPSPEGNAVVTLTDVSSKTVFSVFSPSGELRVHVRLNEAGTLSYTVTEKDGLPVLNSSAVGVTTDTCDFSEGLTFVSQRPVTEYDETYTNISGKCRLVRNHYNETVLTFDKDAFFFDVIFRAYDDGFAYRFAVRSQDGTRQELAVAEETGRFAVPAGAQVTAQQVSSLTASFNYENCYETTSVESLTDKSVSYLCFPALVNLADGKEELTDHYLLLSEAELCGDSYHGSVLEARGENVFGLHAAPQVSRDKGTVITTDFISPWRCGICGNLGDIVESNLIENLSSAPAGDYDWVEPGVTAWMWLSEGFSGQRTRRTIKDYIDLAAEMGWKYVILDEGWQPDSSRRGRAYDGYFSYFDDMVAYADRKGVGLIVWVKYVDLDTPDEREILREWAAKGIKGIKADFFDNEDQQTMEDFKAIYEICAECHLLVNCHGAGKPTGERRTYPNVINREAVRGEEFGAFFVREAVCWAYTRGVVGPMDITPRLYPTAKASDTLGAQLACNIIFESGLPCMAGDTEDYRNFTAKDFYQNLPAVWDETKFIDGAVGDSVTLARRAGENWYAAGLTLTAKENAALPLTFLGEGAYEAVIYRGESGGKADVTTQPVTRDDTLTFDLSPESGYVVRFVPKGDG